MYEYKVIPAPERGEKLRNVKAPEARFALTIEGTLNGLAADGWEFLRAETLPSSERSGFTGSSVHMRSLLVFRRARDAAVEQFQPRRLDPPAVPQGPQAPSAPRPVAEAAGSGAMRAEPARGGRNGAAAGRREPTLGAGPDKGADR